MAKDISIDFELGNKFNFGGLNSEHTTPQYSNIGKDYQKLLNFLALDGIQDYHPSKFQSSVWQDSGSIKATGIRGFFKTIIPSVLINNETTQLDIRADLNIKSGEINLDVPFPFDLEINPDREIEKYSIKIPYSDKEKPYKKDDYAIVIHTNDFDHCIYIILQAKHRFSPELETWIFDQFEDAFDYYNDSNQIDFLYEQAPVWIIARRDNRKVFDDLKLILGGFVDAIRTNEEVAVLKIIKSFATFPYYNDDSDNETFDFALNIDFLLEKSIEEKVEGVTVFQRLYEKMNDYGGPDNFSAFIQLYYLFWAESKYVKEESIDGASDGHQLILDYRGNKIWGFYNDDKKFTFKGKYIEIGEKRRKTVISKGGSYESKPYYKTIEKAHIYQAINVPETNQEGEMKLPENVVPAFFLKAFDDKKAWANLEKAIWLTIDIITTFTGVGNLLKLRHLSKVVGAYKYIKIVVAGIEITNGVLGIMLNFIDECNNPDDESFCNKLRTFLIYVDLATLGVDALASKFIKKSAKDALDNMPNALRKKHPEIYEELRNASRSGQLSDELKNSIRGLLKKKGFKPKFNEVTIDLLDSNGKFIFRLDKDELEAYIDLVELSKNKLRKIINEANRGLRKNKNRYNPFSSASKKYKIPKSKNGISMDFKGTKYLHSPSSIVKIRLTGSRAKDFSECRRLLSEKTGMTIAEIRKLEKKYVWHHLDDLDENLFCTMQLVERNAHGLSHMGSVSQFDKLSKIKYKS